MKKYYVNSQVQNNGDHEVHELSCIYLPSLQNRMYLGEFGICQGAVAKAKNTYAKANGCFYCAKSCHTS